MDVDNTNPENKTMSNMLTMLKGEQWRAMRMTMTPVFTSGKLKTMAPIIDQVSVPYLQLKLEFIFMV